MIKNNIIIAFSSNNICNSISNILNKNGIDFDYICKTASSLRKCCSYYENGIIICSTSFLDEPIYNIIEDFYKDFIFILIGSNDKLNLYSGEKVYKLCTPIKQEDIISSLDLAYYKISENLQNKKHKILKEAKNLLMLNYNICEEQAHKYIQKKSMDTGKKNIDIAKIIINKYKK